MTTSLIDKWRLYMRDVEGPDIFIDFTWYAAVSAALTRKVCWDYVPHLAPSGALFANLYIIFIAGPGVGKSSTARVCSKLFDPDDNSDLAETERPETLIQIAPSSTTLEALYRRLSMHYTLINLPPEYVDPKRKNNKYLQSALAFMSTEELGTLMRENTNDLVNFLQEGYDAGKFYRETKTAGNDYIPKMCTMLFGCATPEWIREVSANGLLKMGFAARSIFVFGEAPRHRKFRWRFDEPDQQAAWRDLRAHIKALTQLYGKAVFAPEAMQWLETWYETRAHLRVNRSNKLDDYYTRKKQHMIKMSIVMHFSEHTDFIITVEDCEKALALLERAEVNMHRALQGSGVNVAYDVATDILEYMTPRNGVGASEKELLMAVFDKCANSRATFDDAISYLVNTGQISAPRVEGGKLRYTLKRDTTNEQPTSSNAQPEQPRTENQSGNNQRISLA